jgi:hypothetical protein
MMKGLFGTVALLCATAAPAATTGVTSSRINEVYEVALLVCPAAQHLGPADYRRLSRSNGFTDAELALLLKFCAVYTRGGTGAYIEQYDALNKAQQ